MAKAKSRCEWIGLEEALSAFVRLAGSTQSQAHIKPLHWYVACRLVVEGGFLPDEVAPRPPFEVKRRRGRPLLCHVPESGGSGEQTVLGGLKTKDVDVTVAKPRIGPCLAVSIKGTVKAFRNLMNRMEEAVGDCTNLHIAYPNLVYAFLRVLRANREGPLQPEEASFLNPDADGMIDTHDVAVRPDDSAVEPIKRYHDSLLGLAGRRGIRNDITRYESVALALVRPEPPSVMEEWPPAEGPLRCEQAFDRLYREYDQRYVFAAPKLASRTARVVWREDSPALQELTGLDYRARIG